MDCETKILLKHLSDAIAKLHDTDWAPIIITSAITVINAGIMIWLAWRQNKLQKQQLKFQEYEQYKELYLYIRSIYCVLKEVKSNVLRSVYSVLPSNSNVKRLKSCSDKIKELRSSLYAHEMEFYLKVETNIKIFDYDETLEYAEQIYDIIIDILRKPTNTPYDPLLFTELCNEEEKLETFFNGLGEAEKKKLKKCFEEFNKNKDCIINSGVLENLENHCKF